MSGKDTNPTNPKSKEEKEPQNPTLLKNIVGKDPTSTQRKKEIANIT